MQYKIPVQIENEDPILFGLSLRQLVIIMVFFGVAYSIYQSLFPAFGNDVAMVPSLIFGALGIGIAIFKYSEMTFVPFVLSFLRSKINTETRKWVKGIDSFSPIDIGYIIDENTKAENKVDFEDKLNKMKEMDEKIEKI